MVELEQRLTRLGMALTFPRADTLADDVLSEIAPARRWRWRRALLTAAAVLLAVATVVAAVSETRHAVARWLGFESLRIEVVERIAPDLVPDTAPPTDLIIETLPGQLDDGLYVKLVESGVQITQVSVAGRLGYWITGEPHVLMYRDADGDVREARMAADALVWQDGQVIRRIEGDITLDRALEIATGRG